MCILDKHLSWVSKKNLANYAFVSNSWLYYNALSRMLIKQTAWREKESLCAF